MSAADSAGAALHESPLASRSSAEGPAAPRPLRVISVQTSHERGGAEYANVELLAGLRARGVQAQLLSDQPLLVAGTEVPLTEIDLGPKIKKSTLGRLALNFPRWLWRLYRALGGLAREQPIDVLLLHFKKEQLMSALLPARLTGANVWAEWGPLPAQLTRGLPRQVYVAASRRADLIVAVSQSTRESLLEVGVAPQKVIVINNMVDGNEVVFDATARKRFRDDWRVADQTFVVGCVSRFHLRKRNDVIIDSLSHLPEEVILVLAGEGDDEPRLRARAAPYGDRVRFLPTPRGYVQEVLSACDLAVFAPQETEGAPRAIIFGQLSERPVVSTAPQGAWDMVLDGTGAIIAPAHDPRALAQVIEDYRANPQRRADEGRAGRALAQARHDPQIVIGEWLEQLKAIDAG